MRELEERVGTLENEVGTLKSEAKNIKNRVDKLERTDEAFGNSLNNFAISLTEIGGRLKSIENIGKWFVGLLTSLLATGIIAVIAYFVGGK